MTSEDAGQYTCTIQNATGSSQASAELDVHGNSWSSQQILSMHKLNHQNKMHLPWISKLENFIIMKL